jgi:Zn-dependent protease with chaperone function
LGNKKGIRQFGRVAALVSLLLLPCAGLADVAPARRELLKPSRSKLLDNLDYLNIGLKQVTKPRQVIVYLDLTPGWLDLLARTPRGSGAKELANVLDRTLAGAPETRFCYSSEGAYDVVDGTRNNQTTIRTAYKQEVPVGRVVEALRQAGYDPQVVLRKRLGAEPIEASFPTEGAGNHRYWNLSKAPIGFRAVAEGTVSLPRLAVLPILLWLLVSSMVVCWSATKQIVSRWMRRPFEPERFARWQNAWRRSFEVSVLIVAGAGALPVAADAVNPLRVTFVLRIMAAALGFALAAYLLDKAVCPKEAQKDGLPADEVPKLPPQQNAAFNKAFGMAGLLVGVPLLLSMGALVWTQGQVAAPWLVGLVLVLIAGFFPVVFKLLSHYWPKEADATPPAVLDRVQMRLKGLAKHMGVIVTDVSVAPALSGRLQAWTNAWVNREGKIRLSAAAAEGLSDNELDALLAHECAHIRANHWRFWSVVGWIRWPVYLAVIAIGPWCTTKWGVFAGFAGPAVGLCVLVVPMWAIACAFSRRLEAQADRLALNATRDLTSLESTLTKANASMPFTNDWFTFLMSTHPALPRRLFLLQKHARAIGLTPPAPTIPN